MAWTWFVLPTLLAVVCNGADLRRHEFASAQPVKHLVRPAHPPQPAPQQETTAAPTLRPFPVHETKPAASPKPRSKQQEEEEARLFREQAESAHYSYESAVRDSIMDNNQEHHETRDGLNVTGVYSYSDGFYKRTVHYNADENGFRVVKEEFDPIGDGPQINLDGSADVNTKIAGVRNQYSITVQDIPRLLQDDDDKDK